ncbi:MAG: type II toxin-antitoxin system HicA family toxin [Smithellaceae bacterium]|jgi:mRNA interferase HicA|nr:type II toxin-antitoxin system HicA family toxin [Smithellaceae bacterium]
MSGILPSLTSRQVSAALERLGFACYRQKGSHKIYVKDQYQVVVPYHTKDLKKGTLHQIIKGAGVSVEEFLKNL